MTKVCQPLLSWDLETLYTNKRFHLPSLVYVALNKRDGKLISFKNSESISYY